MALIGTSFSPQALQDALNATMKKGWVVLAVQAEMEEEMDDMMKQASWVDIRKGMEMTKLLEYEQEMQGRLQLLDPNNSEALNFAEEQSMKSLHTAATGATQYTAAFSVSLGNTAYMPGDNADVKSVESDLFELGDGDGADTNFWDNMADGDIITNLDDASGLTPSFAALHSNDKGRDLVDKVDDDNVEMSSPGKVTWIARTSSGLPALFLQGCMGDLVKQQDLITKMIREWTKANGAGALPPELARLTVRAGIKVLQEQSPSRVSPP